MADIVPVLLDDLWNVRKVHRDKATKLLLKVFGNISANAQDPKFRKLNISAIQRRLAESPQAVQLLQAAGFEYTDETHVFLPDNNIDIMLAVQTLLQERVEEENAALDAERARIAEESRRRQAEFEEQHRGGRDALRKQMKDARREQQDSHVSCPSTATHLKFGRTDKKVDFQTGGGGGG